MEKYNIYDTIIENTVKEWKISMTNNKWEVPEYTKNQINKAGQIITSNSSSPEELAYALNILNNWRSSHAYPLKVVTDNLRHNNKNAIVVQRLKRLDSILNKLKRFPKMSLYRMQDLGGCRIIVNSIEEVYRALNKYKNSHIRHILKREYDYIQTPKTSGYRSYHTVYQFYSDKNDTYNKNILIEIQFRTKLQHIWATALEIMGIYTRTSLKASIGNKDILRFFTLVSSLFAKMENTQVCPETSDNQDILISEIKNIDNKLNIISRLTAISVAIKHSNKEYNKKKGYYLLQLNFNEKTLKVITFSINQIDLATKIYNNIESVNDPQIDSVLVSAASFDALKIAYPNYFADITQFVRILDKILK